MVKFLLEEKLFDEVDCQGSENQTPLHEAAQEGHFEVAKYLIEKGAKVNAKNKLEETPIHKAVKSNENEKSLEIVKLLIDQGANVKSQTIHGATPLSIAIKNIASLLLL